MYDGFGWQYLLPLASGALMTIALCLTSGALGTILGMILGLARTAPSRVARWVSSIYVNAIRGIPLLVLIFFIYFGLPLMMPRLSISAFWSGVIALTIFAGAYIAEIVRGSIEAIPKGQSEAAEALGLNYSLKYWYVIIPQAMRIAVPPGVGFLIALIKDSSLVTVIGFIELTHAGTIVSNLTGDPITTYLVVAVMYFVLCYGVSLLGKQYEKRFKVQSDPLKTQQLLSA
jgi:polar amino acid transport system permease protein